MKKKTICTIETFPRSEFGLLLVSASFTCISVPQGGDKPPRTLLYLSEHFLFTLRSNIIRSGSANVHYFIQSTLRAALDIIGRFIIYADFEYVYNNIFLCHLLRQGFSVQRAGPARQQSNSLSHRCLKEDITLLGPFYI